MRIGIDASNIRAGGGVIHLKGLLSAADPRQFGFSKVTVWGSEKTLDDLPERPWLIKVKEPVLEGRIFQRLWWQRFRLSHLAANACDVLFVPGGSYSGNFEPVVAMSQNLLPFDGRERARYGFSWEGLRLLLLRWSQAVTFRNAGGTIFLTLTARRVVERATGKLRLTAIIPHGINNGFRMRPRRQRPAEEVSPDRPFCWLYVSIIDVYKHQWQVAQAVDDLVRRGLPIVLDLVGPAYPPAYARFLRETRRLSSGGAVRYHGAVAHGELEPFYRQADGFVFASSCETMPIILLEAMTAGLPIACSNRGPMPEVLGEAGVYFDPESPEQIANAMASLMEDAQKRAECAARAFEYASRYTWERCAKETFSFLAEVGRKNGLTTGRGNRKVIGSG